MTPGTRSPRARSSPGTHTGRNATPLFSTSQTTLSPTVSWAKARRCCAICCGRTGGRPRMRRLPTSSARGKTSFLREPRWVKSRVLEFDPVLAIRLSVWLPAVVKRASERRRGVDEQAVPKMHRCLKAVPGQECMVIAVENYWRIVSRCAPPSEMHEEEKSTRRQRHFKSKRTLHSASFTAQIF